MSYRIQLTCDGRRVQCSMLATFYRDWTAKQLPCAAPMAPDPRHVDPVCRLNVGRGNFHGSLKEDLFVVGDIGDEPDAYLLWTALSGEQEQDGVARLVLVGVVSAARIRRIDVREDLEPRVRACGVATVVLLAGYLRRRRDDGEDEILEHAEPGEAWPEDLADWDAFETAVMEGSSIQLRGSE